MSLLSRTSVIAGTAVVGAALTVGAAVPASAAPVGVTVTGGSTRIATNPAVVTTLARAGVHVAVVAPATATTITVGGKPVPAFTFPATGGLLNTTAKTGFVRHSGGLTFSSTAGKVTLSDFSVHLNSGNVVAAVNGGARKQVLKVDITSATWTGTGSNVTIFNLRVHLSAIGAAALNHALGTTAFTSSTVLGTARIHATTSA